MAAPLHSRSPHHGSTYRRFRVSPPAGGTGLLAVPVPLDSRSRPVLVAVPVGWLPNARLSSRCPEHRYRIASARLTCRLCSAVRSEAIRCHSEAIQPESTEEFPQSTTITLRSAAADRPHRPGRPPSWPAPSWWAERSPKQSLGPHGQIRPTRWSACSRTAVPRSSVG